MLVLILAVVFVVVINFFNLFLDFLSFEPTTATASPIDGESSLIRVDVVILQEVFMTQIDCV